MALEAGQKLRQFPGHASGSLSHHDCMRSEFVIGRHFIQILSRMVGTLIMHVHLPNYSKHSPQESSMQRNRLIHLIILLSSPLAVYWAGIPLKPNEAVIPFCSSFDPRSLASVSYL